MCNVTCSQANMYANPISPMMAVNVSKPQTGHHHSGQRRTVAPVHISKAQLAAATTAPGFDTRQQKVSHSCHVTMPQSHACPLLQMADPKSQKPGVPRSANDLPMLLATGD